VRTIGSHGHLLTLEQFNVSLVVELLAPFLFDATGQDIDALQYLDGRAGRGKGHVKLFGGESGGEARHDRQHLEQANGLDGAIGAPNGDMKGR
jgi:hypothetical protein